MEWKKTDLSLPPTFGKRLTLGSMVAAIFYLQPYPKKFNFVIYTRAVIRT